MKNDWLLHTVRYIICCCEAGYTSKRQHYKQMGFCSCQMTSKNKADGSSSHGEYEDFDWGQVSLLHKGNIISTLLQDVARIKSWFRLHTLPHAYARIKDSKSHCYRCSLHSCRSPASTYSFPLVLGVHACTYMYIQGYCQNRLPECFTESLCLLINSLSSFSSSMHFEEEMEDTHKRLHRLE